MILYFDNVATTPLDPEVLEAIQPFMQKMFGNPSSTHSLGRKVRSAIEHSRKTIAGHLNCQPGEIIFTSGGTEADNLFIQGFVRANAIKHIISSPLEHHAVFHTIDFLERTQGIRKTYVDFDAQGVINLQDLERLMMENPGSLVVLMHGNNELGNILDIEKVGLLCQMYKCFFFSDAVQTIGHLPVDLSKVNLHGLSASGHKIHGLKGAGFLYIKHGVKVASMFHGGEQEKSIRGGTENVVGIVALAKAVDLAYSRLDQDRLYIEELKNYMIERLRQTIPGVDFNGNSSNMDESLFTILNVSFPPHEVNEVLLFTLDLKNIAVSGGSACASGSTVTSHVLDALKTDASRGNVRFSFSRYNTMDEVDILINNLKELYLTVKAS